MRGRGAVRPVAPGDEDAAPARDEHERAHDDTLSEKRGGLLIIRGMRVVSHRLRLSGECDVVEFRADEDGVELYGREGRWLPMPVEYKHGASKENDADRLQLCAQAMALEEMLSCDVPRGAIFYASSRRREYVDISTELRDKASAMAGEMKKSSMRSVSPEKVSWVAIEKTITGRQAQKAL